MVAFRSGEETVLADGGKILDNNRSRYFAGSINNPSPSLEGMNTRTGSLVWMQEGRCQG
jgi:hypothetical protein